MLTWAWPWVLLALPLPLIVQRFLRPARQRRDAALRVPFAAWYRKDRERSSSHGLRWLAMLMYTLLLLAVARPLWVGDSVGVPQTGRDLLLAIDISGSMNTQDMLLNGNLDTRLRAVQTIAADFLDRRSGDRVGLILFGRQAYLQTPLTFDRATLTRFLEEAEIGLAGQETSIGDAIGLGIKRLADDAQAEKVIILLTDGANTAGAITPQRASELAASQEVKIYTVGIGAEELKVRGLFGDRLVHPARELDEETLREIAGRTGGSYFRARDPAELARVYAEIERLEPAAEDDRALAPHQEMFVWPLGAALALALVLVLRDDRA